MAPATAVTFVGSLLVVVSGGCSCALDAVLLALPVLPAVFWVRSRAHSSWRLWDYLLMWFLMAGALLGGYLVGEPTQVGDPEAGGIKLVAAVLASLIAVCAVIAMRIGTSRSPSA